MSVLYLTEQGAKVCKSGKRIIVRSAEEKELLEIECRHLDSILLFGNVQFSTQACGLLLDHNIELALLTLGGRLRGQLTPPRPRNIHLRLRQYELFRNPDSGGAFNLARCFVADKLTGAIDLLATTLKNYPDESVRQTVSLLRESRVSAHQTQNMQALLGTEGYAARNYFQALSTLCRGELQMLGRTSRPPRDPMNAILSFGYTLLGNELISLLDAIGLDPYIGVYHRAAHGRPALALDLLETFRHPCVDRFALLVNNRLELKLSDFHEIPDKGWRLTPDALKRFLTKWDKWLTTPRQIGGENISWRSAMRLQSERLAKAIRNDSPYVSLWENGEKNTADHDAGETSC